MLAHAQKQRKHRRHNADENRNVYLKLNNKGFYVDGIIEKTIYEFYGDYWHGNPARFNPNDQHQICHKTHGELYDETMARLKKFKTDGYNVKYIWENEWKRFERGLDECPKILSI